MQFQLDMLTDQDHFWEHVMENLVTSFIFYLMVNMWCQDDCVTHQV